MSQVYAGRTRGNGLVGELHRQGILALRSIGGELCYRGNGSFGMDEEVSGFIFREFSVRYSEYDRMSSLPNFRSGSMQTFWFRD